MTRTRLDVVCAISVLAFIAEIAHILIWLDFILRLHVHLAVAHLLPAWRYYTSFAYALVTVTCFWRRTERLCLDQFCATHSRLALNLGLAEADLHWTNGSTDLEHVLLLFVQFDWIASHENQSAELGLIILQIDAVIAILNESMCSWHRDVVYSYLALMPTSHRELIVDLVESKNVDSPTWILLKSERLHY